MILISKNFININRKQKKHALH